MTIAASAPISAARRVWRIVPCVDSVPVPAMKNFSRGIAARAATRTASFSASVSSGNSPVEPRMTSPASAVSFQRARLAFRRSRATASPRKGVGTGMNTPSSSGIRTLHARSLLFDPGRSSRQTRDGNHEGRAGDVGHAHAVAELDGGRFPSVLPADTHLQARPGLPPTLDADPDPFPDPLLVQARERIGGQEPPVDVERQELPDVVAAVAERHLGEVVGP